MSGDSIQTPTSLSADDLAIRIRGLAHRYLRADREALSGVDLSIRRGTCFGLLGPNGAGKSTLISLMTGVMDVQRGEIAVEGRPATDRRALRRAGALAPQDFAFYPALTGSENLRFFAGLQRIPAAEIGGRIAMTSRAVQLEDWLDKPAETYSGGLKRRLNLAIALLGEPGILYLDEPTVGIDARSRQLILEVIAGLKARGTTIVYTSHYMEEVETLCDEVAVIDRGRLVLTGRVEDLLSEAAARRLTVTLAEPAPKSARKALAALDAEWGGEDRVTLTLGGPGELPAALSSLQAAGLQVARAEYGVSRLETLYLSLLSSGEEEA